MKLVRPSIEYLPSYAAALERRWSADNVRREKAAREELDQIAKDAAGFVASLDDRDAKGAPIVMPDGSSVPRLPGFRMWLWDGEACGSIGFRWQRGTASLPSYCLGHIGYSVVPWKRRLGYATAALRQLLPMAKAEGLPYIEITTAPDNVASRRVIEANGGLFVEEFVEPRQYGGEIGLRFRIPLA